MELRFTDKQDIGILVQIMGVYEHRMLENGVYIPTAIRRTMNHLKLDHDDIIKGLIED